jgi:aspartyl-tRNA(Asn)/glutamyl-tRNA(Gln) amidotransferase subunit A
VNLQQAGADLRARRVSAEELCRAALESIEKQNVRLNAFLTVMGQSALEEARKADQELREGRDRGPLHGIPVAHKDLLCTRGVKTTAGSKIYADFVPDIDAHVVRRWREAGAVCVGKTNLHEHAYGITSNNPHFGAVRNPWDEQRIPGGSSGGAGAALAAGMVFLATGTDTGGSIRCPASYCGVAGLKPTFGLVSKFGVLPLGYTLDHIGPMARSVRETAVGLQAMAGFDPRDPNSRRRAPENYLPEEEPRLDGVRVGWPENFYFERVDEGVLSAGRRAARLLEERGARVATVRVPDIAQLNVVSRLTLLAEAASVHEAHLSRRGEYGSDVLALLDAGRLVSATDYLQAQRARRRYQQEFARLFQTIDILLAPCTPNTAPKIGETSVEVAGQPEDTRLAATRLLRGINALGLPVLAVPAGVHENGLPMALQLIGKPFSEALLLRAGVAAQVPAPLPV